MQPDTSQAAVLQFWFDEIGPERWFVRDTEIDATCSARLGTAQAAAASGALDRWADSADGALALTILLDQIPRNIFRNDPRAYASDAKARAIAGAAIAHGFDRALPIERRVFLYMPFMHSEALADQDRSVELFETIRQEHPNGLDYAIRHRDIIARFGRFPHRNTTLGRATTPAEAQFLREPNSSF